MAKITKKGRKLARDIYPSVRTITPEDRRRMGEVCSLICRAAQTYHGYVVFHCNHEPTLYSKGRIEAGKQLLKRHVDTLKKLTNLDIKLKLGGDPRGYTVRLVMPDGRYNIWGGSEDGIGVPVSK